ncbi:MAG: tRNA (guanosine(46)-N7)-methyltransferase TrmB [Chitinophagales bacterium]
MSKGKLEKFSEISEMPHVFQNVNWRIPTLQNHKGEDVLMKGKWHSDFFQNDNPLILELACGYGEYTMAIAARYPDLNVIGIDVKGNRIWRGAKYVLDEGLKNAAFIRTQIEQLTDYFDAEEVSEIWLTFPDPRKEQRRAHKRLTAPRYLHLYRQILQKEGFVHLKTDSTLLYEYSLESLEQDNCKVVAHHRDVYADNLAQNLAANDRNYQLATSVKTRYEKIHSEMGETIKYVRFRV